MINDTEKPEKRGLPLPPQAATARRRISSAELFGSQRELVIDHVGDEYRLRITSQGKLILTK